MELGLKRSLALKPRGSTNNKWPSRVEYKLHHIFRKYNKLWNRIKSLGKPNLPNISPTKQRSKSKPVFFFFSKRSFFWRHFFYDSISTFCPIMVDILSSRSQIICQFSLYRFWLLLLPDSQPSALSASPRNTSLMIWINMGPAAHSNLNTLGNGNFSANQIRIHSPTSHHN